MDAVERALRQMLTPITQNLPTPVTKLATQLIGDPCYRSLIHNITITDTVCAKLAVSKALGIAIIGASSIVKIPQLLKLLHSQSAQGISFLSYLLETVSYLISLVYNVRNRFPFSTYGETALIAIQNVAISAVVLRYRGQAGAGVALVAGLAAAGYGLGREGWVAMGTLAYLQAGAGLLGVASKVPQIVTIFRQGGTGQLSAFAVFNFLAGSLARVYTTLQEVDDKLILYGFLAGFCLNLVLALQMLYYWNAPGSGRATAPTALEPEGKAAVSHATGRSVTATGSEKRRNVPWTGRRS